MKKLDSKLSEVRSEEMERSIIKFRAILEHARSWLSENGKKLQATECCLRAPSGDSAVVVQQLKDS